MLKPEDFFSILSDPTRLRCLLLLQARNECCVCDFTYALQTTQPKISRHLALLRTAGIVSDRRAGAWIYYSIHPNLPAWASRLLLAISKETAGIYPADLLRLDERDRTACKKTAQLQENLSANGLSAPRLPKNLLSNASA